jgi:hypothetical protein
VICFAWLEIDGLDEAYAKVVMVVNKELFGYLVDM